MKRILKEHGLSEPVFLEEGNFFVVKFFSPQDKILDLVPSIPKERQTDLKELGLNEKQIEALRLMVNEKKTITIGKYAEKFDISEKIESLKKHNEPIPPSIKEEIVEVAI